ncbi:MAG: NAD(P)/FAD-dependent oxidoreductase [Chloroflexi bacterium]|nr:NAD(P)/FAD-dependent oxidoreductase [Chloroflexota bacterium]
MKTRVIMLGAGFGGLELTALLSKEFGTEIDILLIDQSDSFFFGYSKLDVMFSHKLPEAVRFAYSNIEKPGVRFLQETITSIDPENRRVTTTKDTYDADIMVIGLGADYDPAATPGLVEGGNEFYSFEGVLKLRDVLPMFSKGHVVVGVTSTPFKCPPAPSEMSLLIDDYLTRRSIRNACDITLVMPFGVPIPPSPEMSNTLLTAFAERGIKYIGNSLVSALDQNRHMITLNNGEEIPYDLFLGIPHHRVPKVVADSGMTENGWIPVDRRTLKTRYPGVYAVGDVTSVGTPKAGIFAEGAARTVARTIIAELKGGDQPEDFDGAGICHVEFGENLVSRIEIVFPPDGSPYGIFTPASEALGNEKKEFEAHRLERWFNMESAVNLPK